MVTHAERIKQLEDELASYDKGDQKRLRIRKERQEIAKLEKQIKAKKYAGIKQTGKNLKVIGENVGKTFKAIGKGLNDAMGEIPKDPKAKDKGNNGIKSFEDTMRELPQ